METTNKEQQLREAAELVINSHGSPEMKVSKVYDFGINMFLEGAKSEAAKAYHQVTEVNLDELIKGLKDWGKSTGCNASDEIVYYVLTKLKTK